MASDDRIARCGKRQMEKKWLCYPDMTIGFRVRRFSPDGLRVVTAE